MTKQTTLTVHFRSCCLAQHWCSLPGLSNRGYPSWSRHEGIGFSPPEEKERESEKLVSLNESVCWAITLLQTLDAVISLLHVTASAPSLDAGVKVWVLGANEEDAEVVTWKWGMQAPFPCFISCLYLNQLSHILHRMHCVPWRRLAMMCSFTWLKMINSQNLENKIMNIVIDHLTKGHNKLTPCKNHLENHW